MQMIDVIKRLAELDAKNPAVDTSAMVVKPQQNIRIAEGQSIEECGIMPEMGMGMPMEKPSMPASINMTAGSGEELSDMLATIMQLAGMKNHNSSEEEPVAHMPPPAEPEMGPTDNMRSMIDKLNPMGGDDQDGDEEETDEAQYDNSPADPTKPPPFGANQFANQENQPGQGDRMDGDKPKAYADMNEAVSDLFAQYKQFVSET